jgi:hypothetical protein
MLTELAIAISLNTVNPDDFVPLETETQKIVREMFEESYQEKRSILRTRKVIVPIEDRTDFVVEFKRKRFFSLVYYFDI